MTLPRADKVANVNMFDNNKLPMHIDIIWYLARFRTKKK